MSSTDNKELNDAVHAFLPGHEVKFVPIGHGLINSTFIVNNERKLILQRLNQNVFASPTDIISNYVTIENELIKKGLNIIPSMVKTTEGNVHFIDKKNNYWRATEYIDDSTVLHSVESAGVAELVANAFGRLTNALSGISNELKEIIPGFHDLEYRYQQFTDAVRNDPVGRIATCDIEITKAMNRKAYVDFFIQLPSKSAKQRVMHHDAKVSNVLFDKQGKKVVSIVDLDTCQPGYFFSDLGDMIRTIASNSVEDSMAIDEVKIRDDIYHSLVNGYLNALNDELTIFEKENIHMSGLLMIYMQSLRFLTDHINGDKYYKISHENHNLWRVRNQLQLLSELEKLF